VRNGNMQKVIAITGTIASGKSLVGRILEEMDVPVFDTDKIVHYLLTENTPTREQVLKRFGDEIRQPDGSVDRRKLGTIVFADADARRDLEAIVHPAVRAECRRRVTEVSEKPLVAVLIPLLFETGLEKEYKHIWAVTADENVLRQRLQNRDHLTKEEIDKRLAAQWSQDEKAQKATQIIDNSGSETDTRRQIAALVKIELEH
jgi:dephospho-CoA kinase